MSGTHRRKGKMPGNLGEEDTHKMWSMSTLLAYQTRFQRMDSISFVCVSVESSFLVCVCVCVDIIFECVLPCVTSLKS
jgi:hypothetical protein